MKSGKLDEKKMEFRTEGRSRMEWLYFNTAIQFLCAKKNGKSTAKTPGAILDNEEK